MPSNSFLRKAKSCVQLRHPEPKSNKFGYSIDPRMSCTTYGSTAALLRSSDNITALPSIRNTLAEHSITETDSDEDDFYMPLTGPTTSPSGPGELLTLSEMLKSDPTSVRNYSGSIPSNSYLPPKVCNRPPTLSCLRPMTPFQLDFTNDEHDNLTTTVQPGNTTVYDRDSGLGDSLRTIVTDHAARDSPNASAEKLNRHDNLSLFPPVQPEVNRNDIRHVALDGRSRIHASNLKEENSRCKFPLFRKSNKMTRLRDRIRECDIHPIFFKGRKTPREAGRAPIDAEAQFREREADLERLLRNVTEEEELKQINEAIASLGNTTYAFFRG